MIFMLNNPMIPPSEMASHLHWVTRPDSGETPAFLGVNIGWLS